MSNKGRQKELSRNGSNGSEDDPKVKGILLTGCRYDAVLRVAMEHGYRLVVSETDTWHMSWTDCPLSSERVGDMKRNQTLCGINAPIMQKLNHFPGMYEICRKDRLGRNLNRLKKIFPRDYAFFPLTWDLPTDMNDLWEYGRRHKNATYIVKPDAGCQGKGIFLIKNLKLLCPYAKCVCQLYVSQPFLMDGFKFDMRIYALITCVDPLRIYLYNEGIARFATIKYQIPSEGNLDVTYMHLTNYSLNKFSDSYDPDGGSKRKLSVVYQWMADHGYDIKKLKEEIEDVVIKSIIGVGPTLRHNYRSTFAKKDRACYCFELLGFDILVDRHLQPMLIEVNHSPSFNLDTSVDTDIKLDLLRETFAMVDILAGIPGQQWKEDPNNQWRFNIHRRPGTAYAAQICDALKEQFAQEEKVSKNYRLIFREETPGKYAKYMDKEYFLISGIEEEQLFTKKRDLARLTCGLGILNPDCGPGEHIGTFPKGTNRAITEIRQTQVGNVYLDTRFNQRPGSPFGLGNAHDFLKYKYSGSPPLPGAAAPAQRTPRKSRQRKDGNANANANDSLGRRKSSSTPSSQNTIMGRNWESKEALAAARIFHHDMIGDELSLTPSQRVQVALEQLRKKNMEKTKVIAESTTLRKATTTTAEKNRLGNWLFNDALKSANTSSPRSTAKLDHQPTSHEDTSNNNRKQKEKEVLRTKDAMPQLDYSKLPSVFRQAVEATQLQMKTTNANLSHPSADTFQPYAMDLSEERKRIRDLTSRKRAISILGIGETARKVVEMVAANSRNAK